MLSVHHARHAVSLRAENGAEILMHIGLDTVQLGGEGFEVHVRDGQAVSAGDLLISFDIDLLARRAKSLLTPIVLTNGEAFAITRRMQDRELAVGDFLMEISATGAAAVQGPDAGITATRSLVAVVGPAPRRRSASTRASSSLKAKGLTR